MSKGNQVREEDEEKKSEIKVDILILKVQGSSLKILLQRCKHLRCLLLQQTGLVGEHVTGAEWDKALSLQELDITATDLSTGVITEVLTHIPALTWLSAGQLDGMNDDVLNQ